MRLERVAREEAEAKALAEAAARAEAGGSAEDARAYAARVKAAAEARKVDAERIARERAEAEAESGQPATREAAIVDAAHAHQRGSGADAQELVRRLVAEAVPSVEAAPSAPTAVISSGAVTNPIA